MDLLHITSLRRGADGDPKSPNAANYDESKAGPFTKLPDPLILKNGKPVKSAKDWWNSAGRKLWKILTASRAACRRMYWQ